MSELTVSLGERTYPIYIQPNLFVDSPNHLNFSSKRAVVISNDVVAPLYLDHVKTSIDAQQLDSFVLPDGEQHKTLEQYQAVMTYLLETNASRDVTLIALGGGVVGDLVGFVAATFMRGVAFIQIPTTLLAQVDSSVGGKTAVNHPLGKNMIGAFYQPNAVFIDTLTLNSLPDREYAAGLAEVVKYGVLADAEFFAWLEDNIGLIQLRDSDTLVHIIRTCCAIKADIVAEDETEQGKRALLNFGHTFGHAIEAEMGYGKWLHGEAVATGMVLASVTAEKMGWFSASETRRLIALLEAFSLPIAPPNTMKLSNFLVHMRRDKKATHAGMRFILPTAIGEVKLTDLVTEKVLAEVIPE